MKSLIRYLILISLLTSCQKIFFNDTEESKVISLHDFNAVKIKGIYNIRLVQDSADQVVISGKNDINSIGISYSGDTLVIDDHKKMSFNPATNNLEIHFTTMDFMVTYDPVNISDKGVIKADTLTYWAMGQIEEVRLAVDCNYLYVSTSVNTLGHLNFKGKTVSCTLYSWYGSSIFADSLYCRKAEVYNQSVGDIHINSSENIVAFIWGPGNIYYHGTPSIEIAEQKGSGRLIRAD